MQIEGESLDDILMKLYGTLPQEGTRNVGSRGETLEMLGVALRLQNPRARLSRSENRGKPFSALGELLWYLSARNDLAFIAEYVQAYKDEAEEDGSIHGGYGPRLFNMRGQIDQITSVVNLLLRKPSSRRAVVQLFNAEDIASVHREVPCTTTMQFFNRQGRLHMAVTMRSNDAFKGLPHDAFCFTMLQEMIACRVGVGLGEYYHYAGSMHVYNNNIADLAAYIDEGHHKLAEMPPMPAGNPFDYVSLLLDCERRMRIGEYFNASDVLSDPYWADLVRLLQAFWASGNEARLNDLLSKFASPIYRSYLESRRAKRPRHPDPLTAQS
jgi:thymidylate synthase